MKFPVTTGDFSLSEGAKQVLNDEKLKSWITNYFAQQQQQQQQQEQNDRSFPDDLPELLEYLSVKLKERTTSEHGGGQTAASSGVSYELSSSSSTSNEKVLVQSLVDQFHSVEYQQRLGRLYKDRGSQDPEAWATAFYEDFLANPDDARLIQLNTDRRELLKLLYEMVDLWEEHNFSSAFEAAIYKVFTPHRILYILGVCLPMDRAQATIKMQLPTSARAGLHWYSHLHLDPSSDYEATKRKDLREALEGYLGAPTMNQRLYRLCYNKRLGLHEDPVLERWCQPVLVTHFLCQKSRNHFYY